MKWIFAGAMLFLLSGCKSRMETVRDYDMSSYCKDYHVLVQPGNEQFYVLINKDNTRERFVIYKNLDTQKQSDCGFCYGFSNQLDELLKNGIHKTVNVAVEKGKQQAAQGSTIWMGYLNTFDNKTWIGYGGLKLKTLCQTQ